MIVEFDALRFIGIFRPYLTIEYSKLCFSRIRTFTGKLQEPPEVYLFKKALLTVVFLLPAIGVASPWMDVGDMRLRHSVQVLADAALIRVPVNTWPIMWSGISADVNRIRTKVLTPAQRRALDYVSDEFERQTRAFSASASVVIAGQRDPLRGYGNTRREDQEAQLAVEYIGDNWAAQIRVNQSNESLDGDETTLDGSYISALWGNWAITAGAIERWWGPSWESALVLSSTARPVPGLSFQRNLTVPFDADILRWMGPWQLVAFVGQLEDDRVVESAKLVGGRFSFRPLSWLELGISRSAQWGGDGRTESFDSFADLIVGENEPANQLGGLDWRASWSNGDVGAEVYGEFVGEDRFRILSSNGMATLGASISFSVMAVDMRLYMESTDTQAKWPKSSEVYGYAYEHNIYQSGYRYRGRAIGASVDNDAKANHFGAQLYLNSANSVQLKYSEFELNRDNIGINSVASSSSEGERVEIEYKYVNDSWNLFAAYIHYNKDLQVKDFYRGDSDLVFAAKYRL